MGFLGDAFNFELFNAKDMLKKVKKDPERLFIGAVDPFSSWAWGKVTGKDYEPLVDQMGGAYGGRVISMGNPDGGVYKRAQEAGINTGPGSNLQDAAHIIAAFYAAGGAAGAGGGSGSSAGLSGSTGGGLGSGAGGGAGIGGLGAGAADAIPTVTVTGSTGGLGTPAYFAGSGAAASAGSLYSNQPGAGNANSSDLFQRQLAGRTNFSTGAPTGGANSVSGIPGIDGPASGASSGAGMSTSDYAKLGMKLLGSGQQQPQQQAGFMMPPRQSSQLALQPVGDVPTDQPSRTSASLQMGLSPSYAQMLSGNVAFPLGLGLAASQSPGLEGNLQNAYQDAKAARSERRTDDRERQDIEEQRRQLESMRYNSYLASIFHPSGLV